MGYVYNPEVEILAWPDTVECRTRVLSRPGKTAAHVSPLDRSTQTQELIGGNWELSAQFPPLDDEQQRTMRVFIARLRGRAGYFYFPAESTVAPVPEQPLGQGPEIVNTGPRLAAQVSPGQLETIGWDEPAGTLLISAGEYISYDDAEGWRRLHVVVHDCYARSDGLASLAVRPPVRSAIAVGGRLHVDCPNGIFRLVSDEEGGITRTAESGEFSISAVEAPPPRVIVN